MEEPSSHDSKKKKPRPSRGRGLRTTTGCLTCRKRRLKCDEGRPVCGQCLKSARDCVYAQDTALPQRDHDRDLTSPTLSKQDSWDTSDVAESRSLQASPERSASSLRRYSGVSINTPTQNVATVSSTSSSALAPDIPRRLPQDYRPQLSYSPHSIEGQIHQPQGPANRISPVETAISPVTQATSVTPGQAPYEWWDLLAHDAAKNAEIYQALKDNNSRWSFEQVDLSRSRGPSPSQFLHSKQQPFVQQAQHIPIPASTRGNVIGSNHDNVAKEPWNTSSPATMSEQELSYLKYYIDFVGPIFDLFDPERTFTEYIPHLALRNVGLLKSVLAVSARFKSLHSDPKPTSSLSDGSSRHRPSFSDDDDAAATQFYFETLSYLAHAMQYQSYTRSQEILATAALISSYEYFHVDRSTDWEKHLKGVFWIQRSQETNGEREGIPGAVWWNWLRQDVWAALWQSRKPLTIWEPTKPVSDLRGHEFASRAIYLLARSIKYATLDSRESPDLNQKIAEGEKHLQDLQEWYNLLPLTYRPLPVATCSVDGDKPVFPPIWVHPPFHAAALQHYYSAKILVLINRPFPGGVNAYHDSQRMLNEAVSMICGLAQSPTALEFPSAMVHFQALYVAGQCVRTPEQQVALYEIFQRVLKSNRFPSETLLSDLQRGWAANG